MKKTANSIIESPNRFWYNLQGVNTKGILELKIGESTKMSYIWFNSVFQTLLGKFKNPRFVPKL